MQIYALPQTGTVIVLQVDPSDPILNVKQKIEDRTGVVTNLQELLFAGQVLDDYSTLSDYNIANEATIDLIPTAGVVTYPVVNATAPADAGEQLAYLAQGRVFAQTISGIDVAQTYELGFHACGTLTWTLDFLDSNAVSIDAPTGTATADPPELSAFAVGVVAPGAAVAATVSFTATSRSVLLDLVSLRPVR